MLLSTSTEASIVGVYTEECLRAATFLRDVWNDSEWAASNESSRSAFAWSVKDEVQGQTMFEWFRAHVSSPFFPDPLSHTKADLLSLLTLPHILSHSRLWTV